jgi:hypothetical protein
MIPDYFALYGPWAVKIFIITFNIFLLYLVINRLEQKYHGWIKLFLISGHSWFFSRRHLCHSVDMVLFSRVWQTFSWFQRHILPGVLVEQTLENKPTANLGWNSFGDVVFPRTDVTLGGDILCYMVYGGLF